MSAVAMARRPTAAPLLQAILRGAGWAGLCFLAIAVMLSDFVAPAPAGTTGLGPPGMAPSPAFPFGTDMLGRDLFGETLHALCVTTGNALMAMLVVILFGALAGSVAARLPRPLALAMRGLAGIVASVPALLLALLLIGLASRGLAALAAGLAASPHAFVRAFDHTDRRARAAHAEYARATGIASITLLRRDLVYEFRGTLAASAARALAATAVILATLSFLGFGAVPPARDLGLMIASAKTAFLHGWWMAAFPALALLLLILCARLAAGLDEGERP